MRTLEVGIRRSLRISYICPEVPVCDGTTIHQGQQYQLPPLQHLHGPPTGPAEEIPGTHYCPFRGAPRVGREAFCQGRGVRLP